MDIVIDTKIEVIFEVIVTQIILLEIDLDRKVHRANIGPIWGRQDPGGPHDCPVNFAILEFSKY